MAELVIAKKSDIVSIADAVREKTGTTAQMYIGEMVSGIQAPPTLQNKTVTPSTSKQTITASSGYDGLDTVVVNAIPSSYIIPSGTITISTNGTHNVKNYDSAVVNVASSGSSGDTSVEDGLITRAISGVYTNDRVESIGSYAFRGCASLTSVSFPACKNIDSYAFYNCASLTSVIFPACTRIGSSAFYNCLSLTSVSFPACMSIGGSAFYYCSLTSVSFPACMSIGGNAFRGCHSLTSVSFPACKSIGSYAFYGCSSLTSVSFPACMSIGSYAFYYCTSLAAINFPACTSISGSAFHGCYTLSSLTLGASTVCTLSNSGAFSLTPYAGYSSYFSGTPAIYVPASLVDSYKAATNWTYFSSYIVAVNAENSGEPT